VGNLPLQFYFLIILLLLVAGLVVGITAAAGVLVVFYLALLQSSSEPLTQLQLAQVEQAAALEWQRLVLPHLLTS
jgi:hypothetical protein